MTPDDMRATAKNLVAGAVARLKASNMTDNEQIQVSVITDQVNGFVMATAADMLDSLNPNAKSKRAKQALDDYLAKNDALRKAAANAFRSHDWSEFDRITGESIGSAGTDAGG